MGEIEGMRTTKLGVFFTTKWEGQKMHGSDRKKQQENGTNRAILTWCSLKQASSAVADSTRCVSLNVARGSKRNNKELPRRIDGKPLHKRQHYQCRSDETILNCGATFPWHTHLRIKLSIWISDVLVREHNPALQRGESDLKTGHASE